MVAAAIFVVSGRLTRDANRVPPHVQNVDKNETKIPSVLYDHVHVHVCELVS
jgi:hypothetical protein